MSVHITVMMRPPATARLARGLGALARRAVRRAHRGRAGASPAPTNDKTRIVTREFVRSTRPPVRGERTLEIVLMGDREIRTLNRKFHHADRPTDVLAFDLGETLDIAVSVDRARVQARRLGHSLRREIGHLVVHGLLHLSGWRDDSPSKLARMNGEAERMLKGAGWIR